MVISQRTKLLLDNLCTVVMEMKQTLTHLNDVLEQVYLPGFQQNLDVTSPGIGSSLKKELIIKAHIDSRHSQLSEVDAHLMKEKLKQEYLLLYKSYHEHLEDLKSCNLTEIDSTINPKAISLLSQTLQSTTALITESYSKENYHIKARIFLSISKRLEMIGTCFKM